MLHDVYAVEEALPKTRACFSLQDVSRGLQELLDYAGDVEEDFGLTFQVSSAPTDVIYSFLSL